MAIDHIIDFVCPPKEALTVDGILQRLKANARAEQMVTLHREAGDARPVTEIQYQLSFRTPEDKDETRLVYAQEELDFAAELNAWASHCVGCPANRAGTAYGCIGAINYPIPLEAEEWLLKQLPLPAQAPLVWLLMKQGIEEFNYNGSSVQPLREEGVFFEAATPPSRRLGEFRIDGNQVFEMLFSVGHLNPNHAGILLMFFGVIPRDVEAGAIMSLTPPPPDVEIRHPFSMPYHEDDSAAVTQMKSFFRSLYVAWALNIFLLMDT